LLLFQGNLPYLRSRAGGTARLPRTISPGLARELIFTGRIINAEEALRVGLINYSEASFEAAFERCLLLSQMICKKGPVAVRAAKKAMSSTMDMTLNDSLILEGQCYKMTIATNDRKEGLNAFVEKRKPVYQGD